jgi:DNA processing protein
VWQRCLDERIEVSVLGTAGYPALLAHDFQAPAVLFHRGDLGVLDHRRVGIVGTRNATASGRSTAATFGRLLADAGVTVVSGLARGIDGAAHRGVMSSPTGRPVAVVASGLDVVYPKEHQQLWADVGKRGLLVSEAPPGTPPEAYRFPLRNRVLAALSEVLLVVESRASGGSLITVEAARARQVTVLVVPGSAANRASEGTNALARDGCGLALDVDDVLVALGLDTRRAGTLPFDPRPHPCGLDGHLLELIGADAVELDTLVQNAARPLGEVALALGRLEASGWVQQTCGWFERVDSPVAWA